jgi:hypothetical protein
VLPTMLTCFSAAHEHPPCGMSSGEYFPDSGGGHGMASAQAICPSKPSVFAISA